MIRPLPAGLIDGRIEFFSDPVNLEISYVLTNGQVTRVRDADHRIRSMIKRDMDKRPEKVMALHSLGYTGLDEQLEKYVSCCFGAFDGEADAEGGQLKHTEYWACPKRGVCPVAGILCSPLVLAHGVLSARETQVLELVAKCLLAKEIAHILNISEETVKIHLRNIRTKAGVDNVKELIALAYKKNLTP